MSIALNLQNQLNKIDQLKGLVKVPGWLFGNHITVFSNTLQFKYSLRIITFLAQVCCHIAIAPDKDLKGF